MKFSKVRPDWEAKPVLDEFDEYAKEMFGSFHTSSESFHCKMTSGFERYFRRWLSSKGGQAKATGGLISWQ